MRHLTTFAIVMLIVIIACFAALAGWVSRPVLEWWAILATLGYIFVTPATWFLAVYFMRRHQQGFADGVRQASESINHFARSIGEARGAKAQPITTPPTVRHDDLLRPVTIVDKSEQGDKQVDV